MVVIENETISSSKKDLEKKTVQFGRIYEPKKAPRTCSRKLMNLKDNPTLKIKIIEHILYQSKVLKKRSHFLR